MKSRTPVLPCLVIGNLELGGTGKTPTADYVAGFLSRHMGVAIISRGYGRRTSGFLEVKPENNHEEVGDEPLMLKRRLPEVGCFVSEDRVEGINNIRHLAPEVELVVADDAFQHRRLKGFASILCTNYGLPFFSNRLLPAGTLRDIPSRAAVASLVLVNKCPSDMSIEEMSEIRESLQRHGVEKVFFTAIRYESPVFSGTKPSVDPADFDRHVIVTGVARPETFVNHVHSIFPKATHIRFKDHHSYSPKEVKTIAEKAGKNGCVITTEKDFVRLQYYFPVGKDAPQLIYIPMSLSFLNREEPAFQEELLQLCNRVKDESLHG